jgi:hybrid cluster-associated redox disulfide protein
MISQDMLIGDIIAKYPETIHVFKQYNLDCYECQIADLETVGHGAGVHKVDVNHLLSALNAALKQ